MNILIIGMGHIGKALASQLQQLGHKVSGTTTTAAKIEELQPLVEKVYLLKGNEAEKVAQAGADKDLIIVTVAPNVKQTRTLEEREIHYHEVLELSCQNAAKACPRVIFLSSFSVYGDGGEGIEAINESTPTSNHQEPSSKYYQAAENHILANPQGCVLRYPDMYGAPGDMDFPTRVKLAIDYFGGKAIFGAHAPLYAIHFEDVVNSVIHAITHDLTGIYNVCDNTRIPATNKQVFDAICDSHDWPRLEFLNQIKAPNRAISSTKIYQTGYQVNHGDPNSQWLGDNA